MLCALGFGDCCEDYDTKAGGTVKHQSLAKYHTIMLSQTGMDRSSVLYINMIH